MPYQSLQLSRRTSYPNTPSHYDFVPSQLCFMPTYSKIEEDAKLCFRINFVDDTNLSIYCVTWEHNILQCALFWAEPWELQPYLGTKPVHRISKSQTTWREIFQIFVLWCLVFGKLKKNHRDVISALYILKLVCFTCSGTSAAEAVNGSRFPRYQLPPGPQHMATPGSVHSSTDSSHPSVAHSAHY